MRLVTMSGAGALIDHRGGPRYGPPASSSEGGYAPLGLPRPTLGRAPAEPWRASELPQVGSLLLDVDLGARAKTKMTVGDHALTGLQPAHDDGLGAQAGARLHLPVLHRLILFHHEDVGPLLPGLDRLRRHDDGLLRGQRE